MQKNKLTNQFQPESLSMHPVPSLTDSQWSNLGMSVMQLVDLNLGNREALDNSLDYGNALYEMQGERRNPPWEGAANIIVPIVATEVEEMTSRISGSAITPRPWTIHGKDPMSSQYAHLVEQFYNSEHDKNEWSDALDTCIHLAARDGTAILEVLWERSISETVQLVDGAVIGEDGNPKVDEYGQAIIKKQRQRVQKVEWDAPRYESVELRDFVLIPNYAPSIRAADGVARKRYMSEKDMYAMVNAGIFKKEIVERILAGDSAGEGELSWDRQGYHTYTIGNKIEVADYSVSEPEGIHVARGPVEMWQVLTRQYDLDGDGIPEENYVWVHDSSRLMAGFAPFEYEGGRPYFPLSLMPRPNRLYGFSVPDRVGPVQEEATAQRNARLDWLDIASNPTVYTTTGCDEQKEGYRLGPGARFRVQKPDDIGYIQLGDPPASLFQEETSLVALAAKSIGAPQTAGMPSAGQSGGRVSARAAQQAAALQGMQTNRMITRVRRWMQKAFQYTHMLYIKYGMDQMSMLSASAQGSETIQVPREILAQDYVVGVSGQGGPLDKESRRQDAMALYQLLMTNPLVQGSIDHVYNVTRNVIETFDYPDVTGFIGTLEQAQQMQQQQAIQQEKAQKDEMAAHIIDHADIGRIGPQGVPQDESQDDGADAGTD